jgi:hypothetical protein
MEESGLPGKTRNAVAAELSRRELLGRAGTLGLGAAILSALPYAERLARPAVANALSIDDATLQAFFDTIIPGRKVDTTQLGNPVFANAIAGVDPEPGAVEADALLLSHNPKIGFDLLAPPFLAELQTRSLTHGGPFINLDYDAREKVCLDGLAFANPARVLWEAAAAVPFTAFCAAANVKNATSQTSVGYAVMGHPGVAPHGYLHHGFSYRRRLNRGRTKKGYLH